MKHLIVAMVAALAPAVVWSAPYDLVIRGGRVMDPETGLDATMNVGINEDRIVRISAEPLSARRTIDARGLVVAPGFIDLHQHGQDEVSGVLKAFDGVTSGLEMEIGVPDVKAFLARKSGRSLINYGTTASHAAARAAAFGTPLTGDDLIPASGHATNDPATVDQVAQMQARLGSEIDAGALGIGMGIQYVPGATRQEIIHIFQSAASRSVPVFTHIRSVGRKEPGSSIESVSEVIGAAAVTGAPLQIVHINSTCLADVPECLSMVAGAKARGLDVTTEAYPYIAGMTTINSALFNPGWQEKFGVGYDALMLPDTGERLTKERFDELACIAEVAAGGVVRQSSGGRRRRDRPPAHLNRKRRRDRPPAQCGHLQHHPRALRSRPANRQPDGRDSQNEFDARAAARNSDRGGAA